MGDAFRVCGQCLHAECTCARGEFDTIEEALAAIAYQKEPDPRDARIAELEAALAGLAVAAVDAASFDVCHEDQCPRLSTWWRVAVGNAAWESCDEHIEGFRAEDAKAESKGCRKREGWREREEADEVRAFGAAIEAAERALGRRK